MSDDIKKYTEYCLNCPVKPCSVKGCPLNNDIPTFIKLTKEGNLKEAYRILSETTVLSAICGRICPHEKQCQGKCVRGIKGEPVSIGKIEAYIADETLKNENSLKEAWQKEMKRPYKDGVEILTNKKENEISYEEETNNINKVKKVAVIGSGPSGLTCAAFLRKYGIEVTIFEKYNSLGGILRRGIPEFRLSKDILDKTIAQILNLGIDVKYGMELGKNLYLDDLKKEYDAIYLAIGANVPTGMKIPGEELNGVYGANTLLEIGNHPDYTNKNVAVIGGGNVAMDAARTINRMGAKSVKVIYRRAEEQMPAERKEIADAKEEGVEFLFQTNIKKVLGKDRVEKIECIKMNLVQKEGETRLSPVEIPNSNYEMPIDYVIMAVGAKTEEENLKKENVELTEKKYVKINENYETSIDKVFAGGDLVGSTATVAWAARDGRNAAEKIRDYLN